MKTESDYKKKLKESVKFILDCIEENRNAFHSPYEIYLFDKEKDEKGAIYNLTYSGYDDLTHIYNILKSITKN